jgi:hypothetical protein
MLDSVLGSFIGQGPSPSLSFDSGCSLIAWRSGRCNADAVNIDVSSEVASSEQCCKCLVSEGVIARPRHTSAGGSRTL